MRYFKVTFGTDSSKIEKNAKIKIRDYSYENTIDAVNNYMYRNLKNNISFFAYCEEENTLFAAFSFDEKQENLQNVYDIITGMLKDVFSINRVSGAPEEVTSFRFLEYLQEGRRRECVSAISRIRDNANLWVYDCYLSNNDHDVFRYVFRERIIPERMGKAALIYDQSFVNEIQRIKKHANTSAFTGTAVHYVISAKSPEAAEDMTVRLMQSLYEAKRLDSRRVTFISDIKPDVYLQSNNHLEDLIENNRGGAVVIDLSVRFGKEAAEYAMTCQYIEKLIKKYKNRCLFVFTYNRDDPGFSYQLLPNLRKYLFPVMLREGRGSRKAAVSYLKDLIKSSDYSEYAGQAEEFMSGFPGNDFSQTDVLMAFEQFEPWCLCRNILKTEYNPAGDFMTDREENGESSYDRLEQLIGLDIVKKQIDAAITNNLVEKIRRKQKGSDYPSGCMHMIFAGNPGTAKTTVARLFAGIAKEKGILKSGAFVERGGMDLDGLCCVDNIRDAFLEAKGGVLFIDEAYSLKSDIAVTVLIQEMESRRENVIVILAGYNDRMKVFLEQNEGLKSRIPYYIDFPDYTEDELTEIFALMMKERGFSATKEAVEEAGYIFSKIRHTDNFGNGRYVRNLLERAIKNQSVRLLPEGRDAGQIKKNDLFLLTKEDISGLEEGLKKERTAGSAKRELEEMIGLGPVKDVIHRVVAGLKINKLCMDRGIPRQKASCHMVFTGNPGTAKTTVARLFAEMLKDEQVLSTGVFVEVGRADLIGAYAGQTAPLISRRFKEAKGGVLFIDEAYSLCDDYKNGFGDEAINTIVQEMENHRDDVIVIFAGYPEPMKDFITRNPGMASRIAFQIHFEDYSASELCDITKLMISRKKYEISGPAMEKLRNIYEAVRKNSDFGNGRFVRKMIEEAEMNLAVRLGNLEESDISDEMLTTIEDCDIPSAPPKTVKNTGGLARIGFAG